MTGLWLVSYIVLWVLFLAVALVLVSVLRNMGTLYEALERAQISPDDPIKLAAGELAPDLPLHSADGAALTTTAFRGQTTALIFISPGCTPCHDLLRELAAGGFDSPAEQHVIVSLDDPAATRALIRDLGLPPDLHVCSAARGTVEAIWGVRSTPTTVLLDERGVFVRHHVGYSPRQQPEARAVGA